jgi:hypothetical protein
MPATEPARAIVADHPVANGWAGARLHRRPNRRSTVLHPTRCPPRPRHMITENPPVREALAELRPRLDGERIDYTELVVIGAKTKSRQLPDDGAAAREAAGRLAEMVRQRSIPVDVRQRRDAAATTRLAHRAAAQSWQTAQRDGSYDDPASRYPRGSPSWGSPTKGITTASLRLGRAVERRLSARADRLSGVFREVRVEETTEPFVCDSVTGRAWCHFSLAEPVCPGLIFDPVKRGSENDVSVAIEQRA